MLTLEIPGRGLLSISNIILDLNGTLAVDGQLSSKTVSLLEEVGKILDVYILTADTFGSAAQLRQTLQGEIQVLEGEDVKAAKAGVLQSLGEESTIAVGNGENDVEMLKKASIGIAVLGPEGCSVRALQSADILVKDINDALMLVLNPRRLIAGLRG